MIRFSSNRWNLRVAEQGSPPPHFSLVLSQSHLARSLGICMHRVSNSSCLIHYINKSVPAGTSDSESTLKSLKNKNKL
jgi:hypothetical protein